jgi:hypothetical protein
MVLCRSEGSDRRLLGGPLDTRRGSDRGRVASRSEIELECLDACPSGTTSEEPGGADDLNGDREPEVLAGGDRALHDSEHLSIGGDDGPPEFPALKLVDEHGKASWLVETGGPAQYSQSCSQPNWCDFPHEATAPDAGAGCVWYRVVDPHGYYIRGPTWRDSRHTGCAVINSINVRGRVTLQQGATLESVIRQQVSGLKPSDRVLLVKYVRGNPRMFMLTRRGGFLAEVSFRHIKADQWEWKELLDCNDDRLTWSPA